jgi:hypothetical protein
LQQPSPFLSADSRYDSHGRFGCGGLCRLVPTVVWSKCYSKEILSQKNFQDPFLMGQKNIILKHFYVIKSPSFNEKITNLIKVAWWKKFEFSFPLTLFITSYFTDAYIVFTLKMESVPKITIFDLKMMVKSGLKKYF